MKKKAWGMDGWMNVAQSLRNQELLGPLAIAPTFYENKPLGYNEG